VRGESGLYHHTHIPTSPAALGPHRPHALTLVRTRSIQAQTIRECPRNQHVDIRKIVPGVFYQPKRFRRGGPPWPGAPNLTTIPLPDCDQTSYSDEPSLGVALSQFIGPVVCTIPFLPIDQAADPPVTPDVTFPVSGSYLNRTSRGGSRHHENYAPPTTCMGPTVHTIPLPIIDQVADSPALPEVRLPRSILRNGQTSRRSSQSQARGTRSASPTTRNRSMSERSISRNGQRVRFVN